MQEKLATYQQSESSLKEKNNQISLNLDELNKHNTLLETKISELEKKFFQKEEDYTRLLEELDVQKETTKKLLQEKETQIKGLEKELDVQKENNIGSLQEKEAQIKELKKELDGLKADKKYNKKEFDKLKVELNKLKVEKEDNKKINGLKIDKDALMATNNSNKELSEQKSQIKGLEDNNSLSDQEKLKISEEINVKIIQEKKI